MAVVETVRGPLRGVKAGQVEVRLTFLADVGEGHRRAYERQLSDAEHARWRRFLCPGAALQFLVARALLRSTLEACSGVPGACWRFTTNAYGRPFVCEPAAYRFLQFNVSHTHGLVACAVAWGCEIGLDVEDTRRDIDIAALAPQVFAPAERAYLARCGADEERSVFFSYWTLKEAYIKARGMGLSIPLEAFWFDLAQERPRIHFTSGCPDDPNRWAFHQFSPSARHRLALAVSPPGPQSDVRLCRTFPPHIL
jgi:4'-phosphopantetheinyl transferase